MCFWSPVAVIDANQISLSDCFTCSWLFRSNQTHPRGQTIDQTRVQIIWRNATTLDYHSSLGSQCECRDVTLTCYPAAGIQLTASCMHHQPNLSIRAFSVCWISCRCLWCKPNQPERLFHLFLIVSNESDKSERTNDRSNTRPDHLTKCNNTRWS